MRKGYWQVSGFCTLVNPKKLETGLRTLSAGIPYTLLLRTVAIGFPTFGLLLYLLCLHKTLNPKPYVQASCTDSMILNPKPKVSLKPKKEPIREALYKGAP